MTKFKDVAHLYLGCKIQTPDGQGEMMKVTRSRVGDNENRISVCFRVMVQTKNSIDGGYDKTRNYGDYYLRAVRYEPFKSKGITKDGFTMAGGCFPILRPLSDITDEELINLTKIEGVAIRGEVLANTYNYIVTHDFDGDKIGMAYKETPRRDTQYIICPKVQKTFSAYGYNYLLQQGFDLFDLIKNGEAIDAKTIDSNK